MNLLYHMWLSPQSRFARLVLEETQAPYKLKTEMVWQRRPEFLNLNPAGDVPVLVTEDKAILADSVAIAYYLLDVSGNTELLGSEALYRAESLRICGWFNSKFHREVAEPTIDEKLMKRFLRTGEPNSERLRKAAQNLKAHLKYLTYLLRDRSYLAANQPTLADLLAASHLSVLDYLGNIDWDSYGEVKDWYAKVKSRKSFRPLLQDRIPGLNPPRHYDNLDF